MPEDCQWIARRSDLPAQASQDPSPSLQAATTGAPPTLQIHAENKCCGYFNKQLRLGVVCYAAQSSPSARQGPSPRRGAAECAARRLSRVAPSPQAPSAAGGIGRGRGWEEEWGRAPEPRANGLRQRSARGRVRSAPPGTVPAPDLAPAPWAPPLPERRGERAGPGPAGERDWSPGALKFGKERRESEGGARRSHSAARRLPALPQASFLNCAPAPRTSWADATAGRRPLCDPPEGGPARTWGLTLRAEGSSRPCPRELSASSPQELRRQDRAGPAGVGGREGGGPDFQKAVSHLRQARPVALARAAPLPGVPTARASPPRALPPASGRFNPQSRPHARILLPLRPGPPPLKPEAPRWNCLLLSGPGRALSAPAKTQGVKSPGEP
uniref:Uncharacterized protein LOC112838130 n=1 Tax=Callorhinus ursinus TaxID=34884 RepID=A0A3Q7QJP1_CALUR|nr:uncharacterized protein LOC112838130 [Callorhinus ursinus]